MIEELALSLGTDPAGITALSFAIALLGGVIAGFSPCVLPMVPAIFGYVTGALPGAADARETTVRSLGLVGVFILGVAVTSAGIGVLAATLGRAILVGQWALWLIAAVCVVLGLQMLGVFRFEFNFANRFFLKRPERKGLLGAGLFGLAFGLVVPPCTSMVLAAIATLAAASGDPATGAGLLFLYGLGRGTPLLLVAVFSGMLAGMRTFSKATVWLQRVGGVSLIGAAAYLVWMAL